MKVMIVKEVMTGDVSPVAMFTHFCRCVPGFGGGGLFTLCNSLMLIMFAWH